MNLEQQLFNIGSSVIDSAKKYKPKIGSTEQINNLVFQICMNDPFTQRQLFRFIDVLPCFKGGEDLIIHVREYLLNEKVQLPFLGLGTRIASASPNLVAGVIKTFVKKMANCYFAGENISQTYDTIKKMKEDKISFTLDILGEKTTSELDANRAYQNYQEALDFLSDKFGLKMRDIYENPLINISVKISSLYSRFDPIDQNGTCRIVKERLRKIFRKANEIGASVNVDIEHYYIRDITYKIFKELLEEEEFRDFRGAGLVIQSYFTDSEEIVNDLIRWLKKKGEKQITVRLVKGAYWDHEVMFAQRNGWAIPIFLKKWQTDENFERLTSLLLKNSGNIHIAIATHNIRSMAHAIALQKELKVDEKRFEIQMLHGMGNEIKFALIENNIPLRIYTPFGELIPGMSYFVRRLLENSANESFLRAFDKNADPKGLLRNPGEFSFDSEGDLEKKSDQKVKGLVGILLKMFSLKHKKRDLEHKVFNKNNETKFINSQVIDFSRSENRERMERALTGIQKKIGNYSFGIKIGGEWINTGNYIISKNPSKISEVIGTVSKASKDHINNAITVARKSFDTWRYRTPKERAEYLFNVAKMMDKKQFELAALIVNESGKTWRESTSDVNEAIDFLNFYGEGMIKLGENRLTQNILGEENTINYIPKGVVAVISPWNFPLAILTGMTAAAIVTGNTVVMKPSSDTPIIAGELMKLFEDSGLPEGVLNFVPCSGNEVGDSLVVSSDIDMLAFTGSREVGLGLYKKISEVHTGQKNVKSMVLEMGGKNGVIIDSTADVDEAIPGVLSSAFGYQGQKCSACSRVIVCSLIYDEFIDKLLEGAKSLRVNNTRFPDTDIGPIINRNAYEKIQSYIEISKKEGGNVLLNGKQSETDGFYIDPTIIEVDRDFTIAKEEIFGPVLAVLKAKDFEEAMELLNSTDYALTGGLYSRTPIHIKNFKIQAQVGNRYINRGITGAVVERQPFGGYKMSGAGSKAGSIEYLLHFMFLITNSEETGRKGFIPELGEFVKTYK